MQLSTLLKVALLAAVVVVPLGAALGPDTLFPRSNAHATRVLDTGVQKVPVSVPAPPVDVPAQAVGLPPTDPVKGPDYPGTPEVAVATLDVSKDADGVYCVTVSIATLPANGACASPGSDADPAAALIPLGSTPLVVQSTQPVPTPPVGGTPDVPLGATPPISLALGGQYAVRVQILAFTYCALGEPTGDVFVAGHDVPLPGRFGPIPDNAITAAETEWRDPLAVYVDVLQDGQVVQSQNFYLPSLGQFYGEATSTC